MTSDRFLFSRLHIGSQIRSGDLEEFFSHENQPYPPTLSEFGNLRYTKKSDLIPIITKGITETSPPPYNDVKVFDGAAVVHSLSVSAVYMFAEYARESFLSYINNTLRYASRTDIVWDDYRESSLKEAMREKRGAGVRKKVSDNVKMPRNWQAFLGDSTNKKELFTFLTVQVKNYAFPKGKLVIITSG